LWAWDDDWIELGLGGLLGLQGQQVQEEAGASIAGSWLFKAPGKISTVDPTPISGTVDTLLVGTLEGRSTKAMAAEIACEVMPGPNPRKAKGVVGAIDKCAAPVRGASAAIPKVTDTKLGNIVSDLYKGARAPNPIGSGSTADAIRNEISTGLATGGRFHSQKGTEYIRALQNWLAKNPNASHYDRMVAESLKNDLLNALGK
jgi:hypothetical protein